jgi:hypothetical protein
LGQRCRRPGAPERPGDHGRLKHPELPGERARQPPRGIPLGAERIGRGARSTQPALGLGPLQLGRLEVAHVCFQHPARGGELGFQLRQARVPLGQHCRGALQLPPERRTLGAQGGKLAGEPCGHVGEAHRKAPWRWSFMVRTGTGMDGPSLGGATGSG